MTAYTNIHGEPLSLSARDAVMSCEPRAYGEETGKAWTICRASAKGRRHYSNAVLGTGANEEAAWRDAWSRLLVESMKSEGKSS